MDAATILGASHTVLFPGDEKAVHVAYRKLAMEWHPDRSTAANASDVFTHIVEMYGRAKSRTKPKTSEHVFERPGRSGIKMAYQRKRAYEAGEIFVGPSSVVFTVREDNADLPIRHPRHGDFASDRMKSEMERFLPNIVEEHKITGGRMVIFRRTSDQVLLADLITALGTVEPVHVAWMISAMLNLACYLEWAGVTHGAISPDTILVSPSMHSAALVGPALYSQKMGVRPDAIAMPARTVRTVPKVAIKGSTFDSSIDLALIRQTALDALGNPSGPKLLNDPAVSKSTALWLLSSAPKSAREDYAAWEKARGKSFFTPFNITPQDIY